LRFNPWLFSGAEDLVHDFFREVSAQLLESQNDRAKQFGTELERYGRLLSPFKFLPGIGNVVEMLSESAKRAGTYIQEKTALGSVRAQRAKIEHALHELGKRVVIVIDDIDRLEVGEIRDVMRLVRLTADFPGVRYLLAFDRARVEKALG